MWVCACNRRYETEPDFDLHCSIMESVMLEGVESHHQVVDTMPPAIQALYTSESARALIAYRQAHPERVAWSPERGWQ